MNRFLLLVLVPLAAFLAMSGCTEESHDIVLPPEGGGGEEQAKTTCLGCHGSEEMLKAALGSESGSKVPVGNKGDG